MHSFSFVDFPIVTEISSLSFCFDLLSLLDFPKLFSPLDSILEVVLFKFLRRFSILAAHICAAIGVDRWYWKGWIVGIEEN